MSAPSGTVLVVEPAVVAAVAARAAAAVPGVRRLEPGVRGLVGSVLRAGRQRLAGADPARADGVRVRRTNDGGVRVAVDLVVTADADVAAVGRAVQREITRVVAEQTGEDVGEVAVLVLDIEPEAR